jgi:hypothetical protein
MTDAIRAETVETVQELITALGNARRPHIPHRDMQAIERGERLIAKLTPPDGALQARTSRPKAPLNQWVWG